MSETPQEDSKYVDQPDYERLCAEKQRKIYELEGMLEVKRGIVRNLLAKTPKILRSKTFYFVSFAVVAFSIFAFQFHLFRKEVANVADQSPATVVGLIPFDGCEVQTMYFEFGKHTVLNLKTKKGEQVLLPISDEMRRYFTDKFDCFYKHTPLDVVDLEAWLEVDRRVRNSRQQSLEEIRQKHNIPTSGAVDGF